MGRQLDVESIDPQTGDEEVQISNATSMKLIHCNLANTLHCAMY